MSEQITATKNGVARALGFLFTFSGDGDEELSKLVESLRVEFNRLARSGADLNQQLAFLTTSNAKLSRMAMPIYFRQIRELIDLCDHPGHTLVKSSKKTLADAEEHFAKKPSQAPGMVMKLRGARTLLRDSIDEVIDDRDSENRGAEAMAAIQRATAIRRQDDVARQRAREEADKARRRSRAVNECCVGR